MARQKQIGWNKLVATVLLSAIFVASSLVFMVPKAAAAPSYSWQDSKTIVSTDGTTKVTYNCVSQGSGKYACEGSGGGGCPGVINVDGDSASAEYVPRNQSGVGCSDGTPTTIAISQTQNAPSDLTPGGPVKDPNLECGSFFSLSWMMCPLVIGVDGLVKVLDSLIEHLLLVDQAKIFDASTPTGQAYHSAWEVFRGFAVAVLIFAGLVMLIGQGLGFETLDPYTIKKIVPRLVLAVIGIALSWQLMEFFVVLTNNLGLGVRNIIFLPFQQMLQGTSISLNDGATLVNLLLFGAAFLALGPMGLLSFGLTALLALLVAFLVLVVRQLVVVVLILFAPVAIACYVLPNTQSVWKLWHESFSKALLMFPIIMAFLAIGRVFAVTAIGADVTNISAVSQLIGFAAYFMPYFLIPLTFRFAGGAMRTLGGAINDRNRGAFDRLRKYRGGKIAQNWENTKAGHRFRGENALTDSLNRGLQTATLIPSARLNPRKWRARVQSARSARTSAHSAEVEKSAAARQVIGNDDLLTAALHGNGQEADARAYLSGLGQRGQELDQNVASIMQAKEDVGKQNFEDFAAANLAGTGTGYASGPAEMLETINRIAGNDRARAARILVSARGQAERAKRIDLYGAGMATSADQMAQLHAGITNAAAVNEVMTDEALNVKQSGEIAGARNGGLVNMVGAAQRRVARAQVAVNTARASGVAADIERAEHEQKRILAATAGLLDDAGRASPENAQILGAVLGQRTGRVVPARYGMRQAVDLYGNPAVDASTNMPVMERYVITRRDETVADQIESLRSDHEFQQYRREYGSAREAAAAGGAPPAATGGGGGATSP